ncbi:hypothetical protein ASE72_01100 [Sphingomonas sp. Leaf20]|nr:hypothetical protein ASE72_01100 [Sphingomonas sp. Leaf20]
MTYQSLCCSQFTIYNVLFITQSDGDFIIAVKLLHQSMEVRLHYFYFSPIVRPRYNTIRRRNKIIARVYAGGVRFVIN